MIDKAAGKLKSDGWKIVDTTGFLHLIGPLWERRVDSELEFALITEDKHHNRSGLVQGGADHDVRRSHLRHDRALRLGQAEARHRAA